ncbi:replication protein A 70 kDa DNA-binding subunit D-like [Senna tora]|uniref:Replication protein A 70 kDa DNA-binding subunit D-like n=1 Tax=Senna tora TaxID=362788 RepID=A0A834WQF7_9FABA|nr:replication protein A 70 kDa DNA-binding subunit D-like [Senna tora]
MEQKFDAVNDINRSRSNWTIKIRITRLWESPPYPKTCPDNTIDMVLCDKDGSKIAASVKSVFANKFKNNLKEGAVYIMSGFNVVASSSTFRATRHSYKLNFQYQTRIARADDDGSIHQFRFEFVPAVKIISGELDQNILVDVIGRVFNMSEVHESSSSDPNSMRVTIYIEDTDKTQLAITLWGQYANQIVQYMSKNSESAAIVVAFQFCKIKEYSGTRSLSNSMYATRVMINSDIEEIRQFHQGLQPEDLTSPMNRTGHITMTTTTPQEAAFAGYPLSSVDELYQSGDKAIVCILANVIQVNKDRGWFYNACKKCGKKVDPDGPIFWCHSCKGLVNQATIKYRVELMVLDESNSANVTIFDRDVFNIVGLQAPQLHDEHSKGMLVDANHTVNWPVKLDSFVGQTFVFKVAVVKSQWNDFTSFTVQRMTSDPSIIDKFTRYRLAKVDLNATDGNLITADKAMTSPIIDLEGRRLTFTDDANSPSTATLSSGKRSIDEASYEGHSSSEAAKQLVMPKKKIKIEKN